MNITTFRDILRQARELTDILSRAAKEHNVEELEDILLSAKWALWAADSIAKHYTEKEEE